jgi:hypothetical protein
MNMQLSLACLAKRHIQCAGPGSLVANVTVTLQSLPKSVIRASISPAILKCFLSVSQTG